MLCLRVLFRVLPASTYVAHRGRCHLRGIFYATFVYFHGSQYLSSSLISNEKKKKTFLRDHCVSGVFQVFSSMLPTVLKCPQLTDAKSKAGMLEQQAPGAQVRMELGFEPRSVWLGIFACPGTLCSSTRVILWLQDLLGWQIGTGLASRGPERSHCG